MSCRALAAATRTSTSVALRSATHHRRIAHGAGSVADDFSMFCMVFENAMMLSSDSTREARSTTSVARPTRSGRLASRRSKFDCTESMTGYCSLGTGS